MFKDNVLNGLGWLPTNFKIVWPQNPRNPGDRAPLFQTSHTALKRRHEGNEIASNDNFATVRKGKENDSQLAFFKFDSDLLVMWFTIKKEG